MLQLLVPCRTSVTSLLLQVVEAAAPLAAAAAEPTPFTTADGTLIPADVRDVIPAFLRASAFRQCILPALRIP